MGKNLKPPVRDAVSNTTWKDQIHQVISLCESINLQNIELRLPYGIGLVEQTYEKVKIKRVAVANFLETPPIAVYSYLLFVCKKEPGEPLGQYLEIKLSKSLGLRIQRKKNINYVRASSKGRVLFIRVPVVSVNAIDKQINTIMKEASLLYNTVCEQIT